MPNHASELPRLADCRHDSYDVILECRLRWGPMSISPEFAGRSFALDQISLFARF